MWFFQDFSSTHYAYLFVVLFYLNRSLRVVPDDEPLASSLNDLFRDVVVRQGADLKED